MPSRRVRGILTIPVPPDFNPKSPRAEDRLVKLVMIYRARGCKVRTERVVHRGRPPKNITTTYRIHVDCPPMSREQDRAFRDLIETYVD